MGGGKDISLEGKEKISESSFFFFPYFVFQPQHQKVYHLLSFCVFYILLCTDTELI